VRDYNQTAMSKLSGRARDFHDELWEWLWGSTDYQDRNRTIGSKKEELREKYGVDAELEILKALREDGIIK
jgi:hypothetical protein